MQSCGGWRRGRSAAEIFLGGGDERGELSGRGGGEEGGAGGVNLEDFAERAHECEIVGRRSLRRADHKHQLHVLVATPEEHAGIAAAYGEHELFDVLGPGVGQGDLVAEAGGVKAVAGEQLGVETVEAGHVGMAGEKQGDLVQRGRALRALQPEADARRIEESGDEAGHKERRATGSVRGRSLARAEIAWRADADFCGCGDDGGRLAPGMAHIPLEDNFTDVIGKAQRGWKISDAELCARAGVLPADLAAVQAGRPLDAVLRRVARHLRLDPDALEALAHGRWRPRAPVFPRGFAMFNTPHEDMTVNSYLVWEPRSRVAAAFDTGADCGGMLDTIAAERLDLRYIFLTHTHDDHVADLARLVAATGAEVWASEREPAAHAGARTFAENSHFHLGEIAVKTLLTWGHSPGQTTFFITGLAWPLAIVGDALFAGSIGGSREHFAEQLRHDREKIFTLQRDTVLACGHGPLTTLAEERLHNPFFSRPWHPPTKQPEAPAATGVAAAADRVEKQRPALRIPVAAKRFARPTPGRRRA